MSELAEGARLEIVCVVYSGTEGSNPSLSATPFHIRPSRFPAHPDGGASDPHDVRRPHGPLPSRLGVGISNDNVSP